jgi:hypothetical protein
MTAKGYALCVGLNSVDADHYGGWSGHLNACEADARSMNAMLKRQGFVVNTLFTKEATRGAVLNQIANAAAAAVAGDIFVFTNSSHGGQLPDLNGDEVDGQDETLCMFDGEIVDDELYGALAAFKTGVRVVVVSDSCHSGTVTRLFTPGHSGERAADGSKRVRTMPPDVALATYHQNHEFYDPILSDKRLKEARQSLKASVLLIGGCQDNQTSLDGWANGLFTGTLLKVWNAGLFKGCYGTFRSKVVSLMPPDQTPSLYWASKRDSKFENQQPFTIGK